jgi:hypothetical protein
MMNRMVAIASTPASDVWGVEFYSVDARGRTDYAAVKTFVPCADYRQASEVAKTYNDLRIEVGETGPDWEPTAATKFYAQRLGSSKAEFGPSPEEAKERLLKAETLEKQAQ